MERRTHAATQPQPAYQLPAYECQRALALALAPRTKRPARRLTKLLRALLAHDGMQNAFRTHTWWCIGTGTGCWMRSGPAAWGWGNYNC